VSTVIPATGDGVGAESPSGRWGPSPTTEAEAVDGAEARAEPPSRARRYAGPLLVVLGVVIANMLAVTGIVDVDPLVTIGVTGTVRGGFLPGSAVVDPNVGNTSQALGHLVAMDWLHGIVPWWNPFEALGAPLVAEMQSAAFFPPTLLLALPQGQLYFHVTLELVAGLSTWALAREMGLGRAPATVAGLLFGLNGTMAWLGNAPFNPVCFLPLALLGLERLRRRDDNTGWLILVLAIALSIYAGFPETAYLDGLLVLAWFVCRVAGQPVAGRLRFAARAMSGVAVGAMLAAPLIIAFVEYLPHANLGGRAGGAGTGPHLPASSLIELGLPYLYGPIDAFNSYIPRGINYGGGFVTVTTITLALAGVAAGRLDRAARFTLAGVVLVVLLWNFGVPPVPTLIEHLLPGYHDVAAYRYSQPVWELAFALLAAAGVDALVSYRRPRLLALGAGGITLGLLGLELVAMWPTVSAVYNGSARTHPYVVAMISWSAGLVVLIVAAVAGLGRRRLGALAVCGLMALDAIAAFAFPELSAPRSETVDLGAVAYLAAHLGTARFYSIRGDYQPNYGSYFGLASLDVIDVPVPELWVRYVPRLSTNESPVTFNGAKLIRTSGPSAAQELLANLAVYEAVDVRYVLTPAGRDPLGPRAPALGIHLVYSDNDFQIYELPRTTPWFSTTGGPCTLRPDGRDAVTANCVRPATLVRSELDLPGWTVTLNGSAAPTRSVRGTFTAVRLPAGHSTVVYSYYPPDETVGLVVGAGGMLVAVGWPLLSVLRRRRQRGLVAELRPLE
jgi:hypothetical protein